jgi:glycosyltransferase involved in cell wall biosynthesis
MEPPPRIAVITPTLGRPSFDAVADALIPQLGPEDEWWVVADGPQPSVTATVDRLRDARVRHIEHHDPASAYGNAQRNLAMSRTQAEYFFFLDDDDELVAGALEAIRRAGQPLRPLMFRMDHHPSGCVLPREPRVYEGNVGGSMFVVPAIPGRFALWDKGDRSGLCDLLMIRETLKLWPPDALEWREEVLVRCRSHSKGL